MDKEAQGAMRPVLLPLAHVKTGVYLGTFTDVPNLQPLTRGIPNQREAGNGFPSQQKIPSCNERQQVPPWNSQ